MSKEKNCPACKNGYDPDEDFKDELGKCQTCGGTQKVPDKEMPLENKIMTAITKMLDNPKLNGAYEDYKCHDEIMDIFNKYANRIIDENTELKRIINGLYNGVNNG